MNGMNPGGDTALWNALALAGDQLCAYEKQFPGAKKRIICLSDGLDNNSTKKCYEVAWDLTVCRFLRPLSPMVIINPER
jgi:Mg-chelatase subunit ChlD